MELSIVTTLYKSAPFIQEFYRRISATAARITNEFEIVFVNDGSPDDSLKLAVMLAERDSRVKVLELSRNFGHHHAIMAGLSHSEGKRVFLMDVDLEEQPEWLEQFSTVFDSEEADVVYGVQQQRNGSAFKRFSGSLFYRLFNAISDISIPENLCTVRLMSRAYVNAILELREVNLFLAGMCAWVGFRQVAVPVRKESRPGRSTYHVFRLITLFVNAITSFSSYPLRLVFIFGLLVTVFSLSAGIFLIVKKILDPAAVALGYASVMVSLWFLGGLIISFLGIIGLYLAGIYLETKRRPQFIVQRVHSRVTGVTSSRRSTKIGARTEDL